MGFSQAYGLLQRGGKGEELLSRLRPVTLLVACGIVLAATLLIVTGLVAGYLREQTLEASEAGLSRIDAVLVEAGNRSLLGVEAALSDIASHIRIAEAQTPDAVAHNIAEAAVAAQLSRRVEAAPQIAGIALIGADGALISSTGGWPAGETNVASRDYFAALRGNPGLESAIGAPVALARDRAPVIPVAHKLRTTGGQFAGLAVATVPVSDFEGLYRVVPLGDDGVISLMRRDGTVLAQYPPQPGGASQSAFATGVLAALANGVQGVFEEDRGKAGRWRINAIQPLADYPVAVLVSRSGDRALVGWSRQAAMFGAFAICGVIAIGLMVFLIARQFHTHSALASIRAEKIEVEHARLVAEAELMKKERLSVLGQFTASVANELRNPLSAVRNTLFTMREIAIGSGLTLDRPIARIQRSIARCDRIIGDLLEYTRAPELSRVPLGFDAWLKDVLAEHSPPATVSLVEELEAGEAVVRIDPERIRRVVINLIDNAAQDLGETAPGGGVNTITVRSAVFDGVLELAVSDTGPGIPRENVAKIFDPLFSAKSFGTGLGMATVKQIVTQHGGAIGVESEVGVGTTVTIRLPLEPEMRVAA
jgi:signal transduction histidine kinase